MIKIFEDDLAMQSVDLFVKTYNLARVQILEEIVVNTSLIMH